MNYHKCDNPNCDVAVVLENVHVRQGDLTFCSMKCAWDFEAKLKSLREAIKLGGVGEDDAYLVD